MRAAVGFRKINIRRGSGYTRPGESAEGETPQRDRDRAGAAVGHPRPPRAPDSALNPQQPPRETGEERGRMGSGKRAVPRRYRRGAAHFVGPAHLLYFTRSESE